MPILILQHKPIPSVYAGIVIKENGIGARAAVSYSGPTHIAICSGKHASFTVFSHTLGIDKFLELPQFNKILKNAFGITKTVWIITVDNGPDENPR